MRNSTSIARKTLISYLSVLSRRTKKRELVFRDRKVNPMMKVMLLLLPMVILMVMRFLLLLLDVQIVVMNGFLILLLLSIYALIEISSSHMILLMVVLLK
jgi:hypothetical protein